MRIRGFSAGIVFALFLFLAPFAFAILNGDPDGNAHPSVGFIFAQLSDPSTCNAELVSGCSGVLVGPDVFVSNGGCIDDFGNADQYGFDVTAIWVSFNPDDSLDCTTAVKVREFYTHPNFSRTLGFPDDVGVFILDSAAPVQPALLPTLNQLDSLSTGAPLTIVDYGGESLHPPGFSPSKRQNAPGTLTSIDPDNLSIKIDVTGRHICYDAEGGGAFLPSTQQVVALSLTGHGCKFAPFQRLDNQSVRDFLEDFVTLP